MGQNYILSRINWSRFLLSLQTERKMELTTLPGRSKSGRKFHGIQTSSKATAAGVRGSCLINGWHSIADMNVHALASPPSTSAVNLCSQRSITPLNHLEIRLTHRDRIIIVKVQSKLTK